MTFMREYIALGHMTEITSNPQLRITRNFSCHSRDVQSRMNTTTKIRIIFDGFAKSSTGISLNDVQVGPIFILIRFIAYIALS